MEGVVMVWECYQSVSIHQQSLQQAWVRTIDLASTSTHHPTPQPLPPSWSHFGQFCAWLLAHHDVIEGVKMLNRPGQEWFALLPPCLTYKLPLASWLFRFGLYWMKCWPICMCGSSTWWWHGRCCGGMRVLWKCVNTSRKSSAGLGENDWPWCFLLN